MNLFKKSTCSICNACKCCCDEIKITERTYTYNELDDLYNNTDTVSFPCIPTERIVLNSFDNPELYYHQIDSEFYAKNILKDIPLISYAQGPFFEKMNEIKTNKKYHLPTISYVSDPIYIRRKEKCTISGLSNCICCEGCRCK
ncbi:inner membrane complex protein, putative [Plasmodium relictum]|uniref:Inner membrane complex protein, putative n=1 Tax=Plasmodium relictum TaxID=85471 RepID=A0A1J1H961_PLARL|nr:inner membrane complex protein, putative [Plasmodium relictum]CRH01451.1 inner membrane complex protein, putative [Plasmodium relictum]